MHSQYQQNIALCRVVFNRSTKMNQNSVKTCLTDMINISIESFKWLLNEIKQIENKNSFIIIIIHKDALLSKGAPNEMASQDQQLHPCDTDSENTSLLVNNSNISLLFPSFTFMVITFAGALRQAWVYCVYLKGELFSCCCGTINTDKSLLTVAVARSCVVSTSVAIFFHL